VTVVWGVLLKPSDERRHEAVGHPWAAESWRFDVVDRSGLAMFVEYTLLPRQRTCWFWTAVIQPGEPVVLCRDLEVPLPSTAVIEIRSGGLWSHAICETPFSHWTVAMEVFALELDAPEDGWNHEIGKRVGLACDLEWEAVSEVPIPSTDSDSNTECAYSILGKVYGEIQLESQRIDVEGEGNWSHRWGTVNARWLNSLHCSGHTAEPVVCWMVDGPTQAQRASRHLLTNRWCEGNRAAERTPS
jgi:hypothetical protein